MFRFVIPGYYLFHSRLNKTSEKFSWIIITPIPIFFIVWFLSDIIFFSLVTTFIISFFIMISIYEIGYIENDTITIEKESAPTLRLKEQDLVNIQNNHGKIVGTKVFIALILIFLLYQLAKIWLIDFALLQFLFSLILLRIIFYLHNSMRNRWNILTFFCLSSLKYSIIPLLFVPTQTFLAISVFLLFVFPVVRTIEFSTKRRFRLYWLTNKIDDFEMFRVEYYAILVGVTFLLFLLTKADTLLLFLCVYFYFLFYRAGTLVLVKKFGFVKG
jgi:hypothetical protein